LETSPRVIHQESFVRLPEELLFKRTAAAPPLEESPWIPKALSYGLEDDGQENPGSKLVQDAYIFKTSEKSRRNGIWSYSFAKGLSTSNSGRESLIIKR
jgi:hypothetical protein